MDGWTQTITWRNLSVWVHERILLLVVIAVITPGLLLLVCLLHYMGKNHNYDHLLLEGLTWPVGSFGLDTILTTNHIWICMYRRVPKSKNWNLNGETMLKHCTESDWTGLFEPVLTPGRHMSKRNFHQHIAKISRNCKQKIIAAIKASCRCVQCIETKI